MRKNVLSKRRATPTVLVGPVKIGSRHPIVIQSMTNTPTEDVEATTAQAKDLIAAGAEMVRFTINSEPAARAVPEILRRLKDSGLEIPVVGDFHFNGHLLLQKYPETAQCLDKYRINPGNVGRGQTADENFAAIIKIARDHNKAVRIGVNGGSLDTGLLETRINKNLKLKNPKPVQDIINQAAVQSVLRSAQLAIKLGLKETKLILSIKMSDVQDLICVNRMLAQQSHLALHLGLTEAGMDLQGIIASSAALAILLKEGIGDTIRISLTPQPGVPRAREVEACKILLQSLGLRYFEPSVISCPGCGRTQNEYFQLLTEQTRAFIKCRLPEWKKNYPGIERLTIAVMGCVVNGPGESKHADIGISLPGRAEKMSAPVYARGKKIALLKEPDIGNQFCQLLENFLAHEFKARAGREKRQL